MDGQSRQLGLLDAVAIVVGTVLGPAILLTVSRAPYWVWIAVGLLLLSGAAAIGKISESGGPYILLREAFGPVLAFCCGWTFFFAVAGGTIAWLAATFASGFPVGTGAARTIAVILIAILTWVNHRSMRAGARLQIVFAAVQVAALGLAMAFGSPGPRSFDPMACMPAFVGWAALTFVAGEARRPERTVPFACVIGLGVCTLLYGIPTEPLRGLRGAGMILAVGAANAWILAAPWISFAQARDHLFFRRFAEIHARHRTPSVAILMQGVWSATLAITGMYKDLVAYAWLAAWFFYGMMALAGIRRRGFSPGLVPLALLSFGFVIGETLAAPKDALTGVLLVASGVPAYYIWRRFLR